MIVVGLMGGLGNQMFQYCVGRSLSLKLSTELKLDIQHCSRDDGPNCTPWPYELDGFNIKAEIIEPEELEAFLDEDMPWAKRQINKASKKVIKREFLQNSRVYKERGLNFDPSVLDLQDHHYLQGYFQSDLYFKDIRDIILQDMEIIVPMKNENVKMIEKIHGSESVCLHVRRGDYYSNAGARKVHAVDLTEYYDKAVRLIKKEIKNPHFFIFSDEPEWVRTNFDLGDSSTIVDINKKDEPEQDLKLMSECKHFIIANSSFSWWGAWLSNNETKTVIAPRQWFLDDRDIRDRCPKEWIRI